ncbi:hypothetical protein ACFTAO_16310 [Paenibacillus rhizoplanae]
MIPAAATTAAVIPAAATTAAVILAAAITAAVILAAAIVAVTIAVRTAVAATGGGTTVGSVTPVQPEAPSGSGHLTVEAEVTGTTATATLDAQKVKSGGTDHRLVSSRHLPLPCKSG